MQRRWRRNLAADTIPRVGCATLGFKIPHLWCEGKRDKSSLVRIAQAFFFKDGNTPPAAHRGPAGVQ